MDKKLYLTQAFRYRESDSARGINKPFHESSDQFLVSETSSDLANKKLIAHLTKITNYTNWVPDEPIELTNESQLPLEQRVNILSEVVQVLE